MNALTLPERAAIDGAVFLPLNLCKAASLNPRKRFDKASLEELADSIEKHGVMQPVLARPITGAKKGGALYEIIAGERRFRASSIVAARRKEGNIAMIPAIVRELTDFEALELATTENLHRDDLHPLEEAEGFEGLLLHPISGGEFNPPRTQGFTVKELAARIGKSEEYVFASLKLLALIPAAREAFYDDKISKSVALLIARMPTSQQPEAAKEIIQGWAGKPLPFREAQELLERKYMLKLGSAPFKITDETLLPGAGSCKLCPKRTGANPSLFDDIKSADVCTDRACFAGKKEAHHTRLISQAKAEGREVIAGADAKKVLPTKHGELKGYMKLEHVDWNIDGNKSLEKLLGKDAPAIALFEDPHTLDVIRVVRREDAMKVLRDKGIVKGNQAPSGNDAQKKAIAKAKADTLWRTTVAERAVKAIVAAEYDDADVHAWLLPEVALAMWDRLGSDTEARVEKVLGWEKLYDEEQEKRIRALTAAQLDQLLLAMALASDMYVNQYMSSKPTKLLKIAGSLGIDGAAVRAELDAEAKAKVKKPAVKKAVAKKVSAQKTPAAKKTKSVATAKPTAQLEIDGGGATPKPSTDAGKAEISSVAAWPFPTGAKP